MSLFREEHGRVPVCYGIRRLPSAPISAVGVLSLAKRPLVGVPELLRVVRGDPAMVLALLQAADKGCPTQERCTSLRAAIERLGIRKALATCLRFRLLDRDSAGAVDYVLQWRQALLMSAYAHAIARRLRRADGECIQTAAVLCTIGDLLAERNTHANSVSMAGTVGEWLAVRGVSRTLCDLVNASCVESVCPDGVNEAAACIVLAMSMADVWLRADWQQTTARTEWLAQRLFGAIPDLCVWVFGVLGPQAEELEALLQIRYPSRRKIIELYQSARTLRPSY